MFGPVLAGLFRLDVLSLSFLRMPWFLLENKLTTSMLTQEEPTGVENRRIELISLKTEGKLISN